MEWFSGSIPEAVAEAKRSNKLFLVYIEGTDDLSKSMTNTYNDATIAQKLSAGSIIALKLTANSVPYVQFCAIYPVLIIPSSYFIGVNGSPIEIVTGSLVPTEFAVKIDNVIEIHERNSVSKNVAAAAPQASSSKDPEPSAPLKENSPDQPSTSESSSDATLDESKIPLEDRLERAKTLLEAKKRIKEEEEKEKEKQQEIERRNVGKSLQKIKQDQRDTELKEWAQTRAKEKEEERLAREKVREMIAQDRAERAARYHQTKEMEQTEKERLRKNREEQEKAAKAAAFSSNDAHIQFRLPDGSSTNHVFSADATLDVARKFVTNVVRPPFSYFSLCTTFPRRQFTSNNYAETLRDLQLAPSAVLLILPDQTVSSVHNGGNFFSNMFWMLVSPITSIWRLITSFFSSGTPQNIEPPSTPNPEPSTSQKTEKSSSQTGARRRETSFAKREGNVYRINNQSDDDENNTWNGNSTQQM